MNNFLNSEISLSFSDGSKEFLKAGQPSFYLWHKNGVTLFEEPTWFLHKSFVAKTSSPSINTWSASAHDLKTWFQYLIEIGVNWDEATEQERESYCNDYLNSISPRTGKEFSEDTINRRLTVIKKFYDFARSKGYYIGDIGENTVEWMVPNLPLDKDSLAHTKTTKSRWIQRDPMLLKQGRKDKIKPFLVSDLRKLLNHLNSQNSESEDILVNKRNKLILDMGWVVGLRISVVV